MEAYPVLLSPFRMLATMHDRGHGQFSMLRKETACVERCNAVAVGGRVK